MLQDPVNILPQHPTSSVTSFIQRLFLLEPRHTQAQPPHRHPRQLRVCNIIQPQPAPAQRQQ